MTGGEVAPVVLVAHGSRDPRAAASTRALTRAVAAARPGLDVRAAYLDFTPPRPAQVLGALQEAGHAVATLVPLLLTAAYHGRVDIPEVLARARADGLRAEVSVTDVLGPVGGRAHPALLAGLRRRLAELGVAYDGVVLAAAGTRDEAARATIGQVADALGAELGVPCIPAYASAAGPTGGEAVRQLRRRGARRVAVAGYFLAPGRLYDAVTGSARAAGVVGVAAPLGAAREIARLVLDRAGLLETH
ncbi:MAG: cobalamin biosynthesis protein CbiX [Micromonosporaceae bacterium]|jgi:sirohydrochlorin ferrochelatase|nr:cobalamin biosynthesis protein CbiX [Micromonosporaceae bacterium]